MVETDTSSSIAESSLNSNSPSVPLLILTSPLHPASSNAPAITVTRDLRVDDENNDLENYDDLDDDVFLANDEQEHEEREHEDSNSSHEDEMFPCRLFRAADSSLVRDRLVVEQFIADRLDAVLGKEEDQETSLVRCLLEQLECPVCQEQAGREVFQRTGEVFQRTGEVFQRTGEVFQRTGEVFQRTGEVFQCHRGHIMCHSCRPRLLTCPVCRAFLAGPPIRNMALERMATKLRTRG